jgi:sugar phosphate isomerase/epimerase
MRLAASTVGLPANDQLRHLPAVREAGIEGIEIASGHSFADGITAAAVREWRDAAGSAGLQITGLHALQDHKPELNLFAEDDALDETIEHLAHLSEVCRDLGGRTLVMRPLGQGSLPEKEAWARCRAVLEEVLLRIEDHGTVLCLAPLHVGEGDFFTSGRDSFLLASALDHPSCGMHLGTAALAASGETGHTIFAMMSGRLDHFQADEPGLVELGSSGAIDHGHMGRHLIAIGYHGWVSLLQRPALDGDPLAPLRRAAEHFQNCYACQQAR